MVTACFWQFSLMFSDLADDFPSFRSLHFWLMSACCYFQFDGVLSSICTQTFLLELLKVCTERARLYMYKNLFSHKGVNIFLYKSRHKRTSNATGSSPLILVFMIRRLPLFHATMWFICVLYISTSLLTFCCLPHCSYFYLNWLLVCVCVSFQNGFWQRKFNLYLSIKILLKNHRVATDVYCNLPRI